MRLARWVLLEFDGSICIREMLIYYFLRIKAMILRISYYLVSYGSYSMYVDDSLIEYEITHHSLFSPPQVE